MCEVLVVEFRQVLAIVNGIAYHQHGGQCEVVVVDNTCQVFQFPAIDALVGPSEMIAGSHGRVFRIF